MPVAPAERCPECGHEPLIPLSPGVCPDCGFVYDEHTLIWRPRRPWRIYLLFLNTLIFLPWMFRFLGETIVLRHWPSTPVVLGALASAVTLAWAAPRLRVLLSEGHRFAAVTPRGIQARTPKDHYLIPWEELTDVRVLLGVPQVRRRAASSACTLDWIFDTDQEVEQFTKHIQQCWVRHQSPEARQGSDTPLGPDGYRNPETPPG